MFSLELVVRTGIQLRVLFPETDLELLIQRKEDNRMQQAHKTGLYPASQGKEALIFYKIPYINN